jgi:hypothetical protein
MGAQSINKVHSYMLWLYSFEKGNGKSILVKSFIKAFERMGFPVSETDPKSLWGDYNTDIAARNFAFGITEIADWQEMNGVSLTNMNKALDMMNYRIRKLYENPIDNVSAKAVGIVASNILYDKANRRISTLFMAEAKWKVLNKDNLLASEEELVQAWIELIENTPSPDVLYFDDIDDENTANIDTMEREIEYYCDWFSGKNVYQEYTLKSIVKSFHTAHPEIKIRNGIWSKFIDIQKDLLKNNIVKKVGNNDYNIHNASFKIIDWHNGFIPWYNQYILNLQTGDRNVYRLKLKKYVTDLFNLSDESDESDKILQTPINNSNEKSLTLNMYTDEKSSLSSLTSLNEIQYSNAFFKETYHNVPEYIKNEYCQFETINPLLPGKSRLDDNVSSFSNFLFEMDDTDLDVQRKLAEEYINSGIINRAVFSGNKSIHMRISLKNPPNNKEEYHYVWKLLKETYFKDYQVDIQNKNPSRLTRTPDVLRHDTNKLQELLFSNDTLLFFPWEETLEKNIEDEKRRQHMKRVKAAYLKSRNINKVPYDKLYHQEARDILDWNVPKGQRVEILSYGLPNLLSAGYSIDEIKTAIEQEPDDDRMQQSLDYFEWILKKNDQELDD